MFSPGDEYNGWLKWIAAHPESNGGLVTFPPAAGGVGVQQMTRILSGEEVTKGIHVPSVWYAPEDAVRPRRRGRAGRLVGERAARRVPAAA